MLVVKVELHSAITGKESIIGIMHIINDGTGSHEVGNYDVRILTPTAEARRVEGFLRKRPVWELVHQALDTIRKKHVRKLR